MIYSGEILIPYTCPLRFGMVEYATELHNYPNAFKYVQEFVPSDVVHVQLQHNVASKTLTLKCCDWYTDLELASGTFDYTDMSGISVYDARIPLYNISGAVIFKVYDGSELLCDTIIGQDNMGVNYGCIVVQDSSDTIRFDYWDSENRHETRFGTLESKNMFSYRVRGGFKPFHYTPKNEFDIFPDQSQSPTLVYSCPDFTQKLSLSRLPSYAIHTLNYIFGCDVVMIGNLQWQAVELIKEETVVNDLQIPSVVMKLKTNRQFQNVGGSVYITDRYSNILSTNNDELFIL